MTESHATNHRERLYEIIFEADTPLGKFFDIGLLLSIGASVVAVCIESVDSIADQYGAWLTGVEWWLTIAFTIEYLLRLYCVRRPMKYALSFYGVVDLLAIIPTYLSLFFVGSQSLAVIRAIRLLRVFRVFKLAHFIGEANHLRAAMTASLHKITIFLGVVITLVLILGSLMYLIEGRVQPGFDSIPDSMYWAIVTMTTVGYGDVAPITIPGKFLASVIMIVGYGILAVPTGIVTVELGRAAQQREVTTRSCPSCVRHGHASDAKFCKYCGEPLV